MNPYKIIGVPNNATSEEIKKAYRKIALRHHPDRTNGSELSQEFFVLATKAYEILSSPEAKRKYDEQAVKAAQENNTQKQAPPNSQYQYTKAPPPAYNYPPPPAPPPLPKPVPRSKISKIIDWIPEWIKEFSVRVLLSFGSAVMIATCGYGGCDHDGAENDSPTASTTAPNHNEEINFNKYEINHPPYSSQLVIPVKLDTVETSNTKPVRFPKP